MSGLDLAQQLDALHNLGECVLLGMDLRDWGYSAEFRFNYIWDDEGRVRPDLDDRDEIVVLRLVGVEELTYAGELTPIQKADPQVIDWGFGEVASVRSHVDDDLTELTIQWETNRVIRARAVSVELLLDSERWD